MDLLISFDTTGSMYPALTEVRRKVSNLIDRLFNTVPELRVGLIAHGDYVDKERAIEKVEFTTDKELLINFVNSVHSTDGGDGDEFYELVLHLANNFKWQSEQRVMILIADADPHNVSYRNSWWREYPEYPNIDWKREITNLRELGIIVYPIQALNHSRSGWYYDLAKLGGGVHLRLNQFSDITDYLLAITHKQAGKLEEYQTEIGFRMNRNLAQMFCDLGSTITTSDVYTKKREDGLVPVPPFRFQVLHVDRDQDIKSFVLASGATFKQGRGFYQFTKRETVQEKKEVVLRDKETGDMFTGSEAREMIGLPYGMRGDIKPIYFDRWDVFVQSTSNNRKLIGGTLFLYEAE